MLKNKIIVRKIRNIVILLMAMAIMVGAYRFIDRSKAEKVVEIGAIALDDYGYLEDEEITLEAKQVEDGFYEVLLPDSINTKKINRIVKIGLGELSENKEVSEGEEKVTDVTEVEDSTAPVTENATVSTEEPETKTETETVTETASTKETPENTEESLEVIENRIYLTKEQIQNEEISINLSVIYDQALLTKNPDNTYTKTLLAEKSEEEIAQILNTEGIQLLYNKVLKYEDEKNGKLVELKAYLPVDAELQVEEVAIEELKKERQKELQSEFMERLEGTERLEENLEMTIVEPYDEMQIEVAYDIKILRKIVTKTPVDEADPTAKPEEIVETIEINPGDYREVCEVTITDAKIEENAEVYHIGKKRDYEQVSIIDNSKGGNVSFEAYDFSTYVVVNETSNDEIETIIDDIEMSTTEITDDIVVSTTATTGSSTLKKLLYNEATSASGFLGNTAIAREDIESVTFLDSTSGKPATGTWDVSAAGDRSIIAWYTGTNPYQVYIASDVQIKANADSSYLFAYIGSGENCTATSVINNIHLLDTSETTNMSAMFKYCGYTAMTSLDLGNNFNTSKVENMRQMFYYCGSSNTSTLNLGSNFNTSNVKDMGFMFSNCKAQTIELGKKFNTENVTKMDAMFQLVIATIDLGDNFDTSNVTDMGAMFNGYGGSQLDLGEKFDTGKVLDMSYMFSNAGANKMKSLDLGEKFSTFGVMDMNHMFQGTGYNSLEVLEMGPLFTRIPMSEALYIGFVSGLGKVGCIVYCPEEIFENHHAFRLSYDVSDTIEYTRGTINPYSEGDGETGGGSGGESGGEEEPIVPTPDTEKPVWKLVSAKYEETDGSASIVISGTDNKLLSSASLKASDLTIFINSTRIDTTRITVGDAIQVGDGRGGVKYPITISNYTGGNISITIPAGNLKDAAGNLSDATTISINSLYTEPVPEMESDRPEIRYVYSDTDINKETKKLTVTFSVVDRNFKNSSLELEDLIINIDGIDVEATEVTSEFTSITDVKATVDGKEKVIGKEYTLLLSDIEKAFIQEGGIYANYSGIVMVTVPADIAVDESGNINLETTITVGININGEDLNDRPAVNGSGSNNGGGNEIPEGYTKPSDLYAAGNLQIGDFVNYDAGTWTQDEINEIKTGLTSSPVTANGSTSLPNTNYQFGGFTAGSSRNGNAKPYSSSYNYIKDENRNAVTGWRVFDIDGETVTLISAGNPEDYYHGTDTNSGYISAYILSGDVNSSWSGANTSQYQKRDWSDYVNPSQKGKEATALSKTALDKWYSKYTDAGSNPDTYTYNIFQKIYENPYFKYQNLFDNNSFYWIASSYDSNLGSFVNASQRKVLLTRNMAYGVRVLVTLETDTLFAENSIGEKTLSGGNMNGEQTYNVWKIGEPAEPEVPEEPNEPDEPEEYDTPSNLYTDGKLQIGDFVNYDAGTWTEEEIELIKTGLKSNPVTANGSTDLPDTAFQFGGFEAGASRNENATTERPSTDYIRDSASGKAITGWRVFDINNDGTVTLISAGNPEAYYQKEETNHGYISEYIFTGNVNSSWSSADVDLYQKRDWSDYENAAQKGNSATVLTKTALASWYSKYIGLDADSGLYNEENFQKLYENSYVKYQNIVDTYTGFWVGETIDSPALAAVETRKTSNLEERGIYGYANTSLGVRILVTLDADVLFASQSVGTKTLSGGNMDTYGGAQTYNVWNIGAIQSVEQEPQIVDVVDPLWTIKNIEQDRTTDTVKITIDATDKYLENSTLEIENIKIKDVATGEEITNIDKSLSRPTQLRYLEDGERKLYGQRYILTLSGFEEAARRPGMNYKEWSGDAILEIPAETAVDKHGNKSKKAELTLGRIDLINPEFTYTHATADINETDETVTIKFSVTDKFYKDEGPMDFDDFTILVDGVELLWQDEIDTINEGYAVKRELTSEKIEETRNGEKVTIGYTYTVELSNLEPDGGRDGYIWSGVFSIAIPEGKVQDTTGNTNLAQTITMGIDMPKAGLPSTEHSTPYLPVGYTYVTGTINTGIVIRDPLGNEYVWIDIPRNTNVYTETTLAYDLDTLADEDLENAYTAIETELKAYASDNYSEEGLSNTHLGDNSKAGLDDEQYAKLKEKMLKSIFQNGGFYAARNEATFEEGVTIAQAQELSSKYAENLSGYTSALMFGLQHNLLLKSLETKGITDLTDKDTAYNINNLSGETDFRIMLFSESKETPAENDEVIVDLVRPVWGVYTNVNQVKKQVDIDLSIVDKYFKQGRLSTNDIKIYIDGQILSSTSNVKKNLSGPVPITEKRIVDGVQQDVQVGLKYTLTLSNWEELTRRSGKLYKEYSGNVSIAIDGGLATDKYGNTSISQSVDLGLIDLIKPEYTYKYSEADIDHNLKTVKVVFTVADKYYQESTTLKIDDLKILIDGQEPEWLTEESAETDPGVKKTLTSVPIKETRNGSQVTVGYTYTLLLEELEQDEISGGKNYLDYSGVVTVGIPGEKVYDTIGNYNPAQTITLGIDITGNTGGQIEEEDEEEGKSGVTTSGQYMPQGYKQVEGTDLSTGLVIENIENGNQFVWVEVPQTSTVYKTAGLNITEFTDEAYKLIEDDLIEYTATYRYDVYGNETAVVDEYYSDELTGLTKGEYNLQKKKMLKSIYKNGGFYVGRYETGIESSYRTAPGDATQIPVIKQHAYPYNYVTVAQAQTLSENFAKNLNGYTSSLIFYVQWDLILKYLETKAVEGLSGEEYETALDTIQYELASDSSSWGNYYNSQWTSDANSKYSFVNESTWRNGSYTKRVGERVLSTTGASDKFAKQNIYNLASNVSEWNLGYGGYAVSPVNYRGASYGHGNLPDDGGVKVPASFVGGVVLGTSRETNGFRTALYKDEGVGAESSKEAPTYIPGGYKHVAGTTMENGYVIKDSDGNEFVWVEVPRTAEIYGDRDAEGKLISEGILATDIDSLTGEAFTNAINTIEQKLHEYTMTYRTDAAGNETTFTDTHSGNDATTGLSSAEYTLLKQKMLKSIFKNEGFYIARYETGTTSQRTAGGNIEAYQPVIKQNVYPYNHVTTSEAQSLAKDFATDGYETNLMFGIQWDLALRYLESKGASTAELDENSSSWGNYASSLAKTGSSNTYAKQNIYDLAGNVWEAILEYSNDSGAPFTFRGGSYAQGGSAAPASWRTNTSSSTGASIGFRISLFRDEGAEGTTGQVADVVDPLVEIDTSSVAVNTANQTVTVDVKVTDKFFDAENAVNYTLIANEIKVYEGAASGVTINVDGTVTGNELAHIEKEVIASTPLTETRKVNGVDTPVTYGYKYTIKLSNWAEAARRENLNYKEWSGDTTLVITKGAITDQYTNSNKTTALDMGSVDAIKPEFTYVYAGTSRDAEPSEIPEIDYDGKKLTVKFSVADKFFYTPTAAELAADPNANKLTIDDLTILIDGTEPTWKAANAAATVPGVVRTLTSESITENGITIGTKYTLELTNLEQNPNDGFDFSGVVSIGIEAGKIRDTEGHTNEATTITIGVNETDGNPNATAPEGGVIVDVVDPVWTVGEKTVTTNPTTGITSALVELLATDKYFKESTLTMGNLQVLVAGEDKTSILDVDLDGPTAETNGDSYTFSLSNFEESYDEFLAERAKYAASIAAGKTGADIEGRLYREFSGPVQVVVPAGTAEDQSGNKSQVLTVDLGTIDTLKPEVVFVSSELDDETETQTIVFDITDKNFDEGTAQITETNADKIHVIIDGTEAPSATKPTTDADKIANAIKIWKEIVDIEELTTTINGDEVVIGHRYTMVLSNFENSRNAKGYKEHSGDVSIKVDADAVKDANGTGNAETTFATEFVDFVEPSFSYTYAASDFNQENETVIIKFSVTDKYYVDEGPMNFGDFKILVDEDELTWDDGIYDEVNNIGVKREFVSKNPIKETRNGETVTVGYEYTIKLSNVAVDDPNGYIYSGVFSIAIPEGKAQDTSGNTNFAQTITMGIDMPGELPNTAHTTPYLPDGYSYATGTINTGIVIRDQLGNEYVWIDVPRNTNVYTETTLAFDLDTLTGEELTNALNAIETELRTYTTGYTEDGLEDVCLGSDEQYTELKQKMLKSIFQNGGFYVARNEATFEEEITIVEAQTLARAYAENLGGYTSSLMFSLQHNLLLKSLETKGYTSEYLSNKDTAYNINNLSGDTGFRVMLISESKETAGGNNEVIADSAIPGWHIYTNINHVKKQVEIDLSIKDKFFKQGKLTTNDIDIYVDDINVTNSSKISKNLIGPVEITEKRIVDGVQQDVQVGLKYTLTLGNWEELTRQKGKLYKEYSGYTTIVINKGGLATDYYGNQSVSQTFNIGLIDVIKPEYTYKYSESHIDHNLKTVKVVFSVADKYYQESTALDIADLKILIDGNEPNWKATDVASSEPGVKKTLTYEPIPGKRMNDEGQIVDATVGYTYTLLLEELEQDEKAGGKNYLDYSGVVTVGIPGEKVYDISGNYNPAQTITLGIDLTGNTGGQIEDEEEGESGVTTSGQYLPQGFIQIDSDGDNDLNDELDNGLVVEDENGNQYVWVEVPKTSEVYKTAGLNVTEFTDEVYELIENDLHEYTMTYRTDAEGNETTAVDEYTENLEIGLTKTEYKVQKYKMLKSIYKNGGFYVGRYETGIMGTYRGSSGDASQVPVIKQHTYPYNWVTVDQAQTLSESFAKNLTGYTSSLMFGVQWDLILKYLEIKAVEQGASLQSIQEQLNVNSTSWGNSYSSTYYIDNSEAKYKANGMSNGWKQVNSNPFNKTASGNHLLSTGASENFKKQNIYDLAGNCWEFTLERRDEDGINARGGFAYYWAYGAVVDAPASYRGDRCGYDLPHSFRVALYTDEEVYGEEPSYIPTNFTHVEGTMDEGFVVEDPSGNQYVWVEVPKTAEVYATAGLDITEFADEDYEKIETDLQTYTSYYRKTASGEEKYEDNYLVDNAFGLIEEEYYTQKKKMLKSIYKNGGFYVGRYEAGIEGSYRTGAKDATEVPVIKQNAYPYNYATPTQAQTLSESFAKDLDGYTSSLMFGVQWDLILKYLETKAVEQGTILETIQNELNTNSTSWGNLYNSTYKITNTKAKYWNGGNDGSMLDAPYDKTAPGNIMLTTGADDMFSKQNIYNLAGNVMELTLSLKNNTVLCRGGSYNKWVNANAPAGGFGTYGLDRSDISVGFRTALYKDDGTGADSSANAPKYIPNGYEHVAGTTMDNGYVIKDSDNNEFVWVEVPRTAEIYGDRDAEGKLISEGILAQDIDSLTGEAFTNAINTIEQKLKAYVSTYRTDAAGNETTYTDTHSGDAAKSAGLSSDEYTLLKQKMLKSIFKNGGFYIARYETGTTSQRTAGGNIEAYQPVIKQNVYPYNYVTTAQAQSLAENFKTDGYETNLMFGLQWDLALRYLETKGASTEVLDENSASWGNFGGSLAKTGSNNTYAKQNISDLAGNVWEWTLEYSGSTEKPNAMRGGSYYENGGRPASRRHLETSTWAAGNNGFRISLFRDEGTTANAGVVADVVDPLVEISNVNVDDDNQVVTMDLTITDKYFDANDTLTADEIKIFGGETTTNADGTTTGTEITQIVKTLSEPEILKETQKINGVDTEVQYGVKYTLTLTNWQAAYRASGKLYKEWSGDTTVVITEDAIVDQYTNGNKVTTYEFDQLDLIRPEFTYTYAEADIDREGETVTIKFSVADKFYDDDINNDGVSDGPMDFEDFMILVDGEEPVWKDEVDANINAYAVKRELTTEKIEETRNGETVTVGYTYTVKLSDLQKSGREQQ